MSSVVIQAFFRKRPELDLSDLNDTDRDNALRTLWYELSSDILTAKGYSSAQIAEWRGLSQALQEDFTGIISFENFKDIMTNSDRPASLSG